jgi:hypothetical protein
MYQKRGLLSTGHGRISVIPNSKNGQMRPLATSLLTTYLTIFYLPFLFFSAIPRGYPGRKETQKSNAGCLREKGGGGAPLFPTDRTPDICIRSLFGFGIVEFGIAAAL